MFFDEKIQPSEEYHYKPIKSIHRVASLRRTFVRARIKLLVNIHPDRRLMGCETVSKVSSQPGKMPHQIYVQMQEISGSSLFVRKDNEEVRLPVTKQQIVKNTSSSDNWFNVQSISMNLGFYVVPIPIRACQ